MLSGDAVALGVDELVEDGFVADGSAGLGCGAGACFAGAFCWTVAEGAEGRSFVSVLCPAAIPASIRQNVSKKDPRSLIRFIPL